MKMKVIYMTLGMREMLRTFLWNKIGTLLVHKRYFVMFVDYSGDVDIVDAFQKFFDLTLMQNIVHIEQDGMYVVLVSANRHIAEMNTKLLLQQPLPCVNSSSL
jgi:hypothetical protein